MNVDKWRVYCETDSKYEYAWRDENQGQPTTCPVDTAHTITSGSQTIVDSKRDVEVIIKEEDVKTGGHYQARTFEIDVAASDSTKELEISFPFPVSLLAAEWVNKAAFEGDQIQVCVGMKTTIGSITENVAASATTFDVSQSVIDNAFVGQLVHLSDGTNEDLCGRIISIDSVNKKITCETATTQSFLAATPTYVKVSVEMMPKGPLDDSGRAQVGGAKIGGSYIPANTTVTVTYFNDSGTAKKMRFVWEYLY